MFRTLVPLLLISAACSSARAQTLKDPTLTSSIYVTGLIQPTQLRFLGANDLFVAEKGTGKVQRVLNGVKSTVLDLNVMYDSERGLLGLTLDPGFATNNFVYAYYSATNAGADSNTASTFVDNRLVRFTWNGTTLGNETLLQTFASAGDGLSGGPNHDGGPITFGPDGKLYGVTGDFNRSYAEQNNQAQSGTSSHVGGIYRLAVTAGTVSIPADNPFAAQTDPSYRRLYAYGVRNSFGLAFDPLTNKLWDTENGPASYDEINAVASGFNSGWTKIMGPDARNTANVSDLVSLPNSAYSDPEFSFLNPVAVTGITFLAGSQLNGSYRDAVIVGDSNNGNLYVYRLNTARDAFVLGPDLVDGVADTAAERDSLLFGQGFGVVTDLQIGPDKALYITDLANGRIIRVVPEPASWLLASAGLAVCTGRRRRRST